MPDKVCGGCDGTIYEKQHKKAFFIKGTGNPKKGTGDYTHTKGYCLNTYMLRKEKSVTILPVKLSKVGNNL